jgi:hypothetical protein
MQPRTLRQSPSMKLRKPSSRRALWVFAAALLLKAAMPLLASASAQMQGKALVEVCTVYGVSQVPPGGQEQGPASGHAPAHGNEHCALNAMTALATGEPSLPAVASVSLRETAARRPRAPGHAPDACAIWVARLKHGPPRSA